MSRKFHVNKEGEPGVCKAIVECPFGDFKKDHYDTADDARKAYEVKMQAKADYVASPFGRLRDKMSKISETIREGVQSVLFFMATHPNKLTAAAATVGTVLGSFVAWKTSGDVGTSVAFGTYMGIAGAGAGAAASYFADGVYDFVEDVWVSRRERQLKKQELSPGLI